MSLELTWWNQKTYDQCKEVLSRERRVAITNATGTGKTSVMSKLILDYYNGKGSVLVLAPRKNIIDQYKDDFYELPKKGIIYSTYSKIARDFTNDLLDITGLSLVVCDELHRTGAETYLPAIEKIILENPNAKIIGASATPKRTEQRLRDYDMIDELFDGNRVGNMDVTDAMNKGILPKPTYVSAMFSVDERYDKLDSKVAKLKDEEQRKLFAEQIKESRIDWQNSYGQDKIIKEFLRFDDMDTRVTKILVFCKGKEHINELRDKFDPIFIEMFSDWNLFIDEYHSGTPEKVFEDFRDREELGSVSILYSINKFTEGVHVDNLDAAIIFRDTISEIIYLQQIGRVLSISGRENPIIIDFVNSPDKVAAEFWGKSLEVENDFMPSFADGRGERKGRARDIKGKFIDICRNAIDMIEKMDSRIIESTLYSYNGEKGTITYFADKYHKDRAEIYTKINTQGMTMKEAIETSLDLIEDIVEYNGQEIELAKLCRIKKVNLYLIKYRLDHGKTIYEALGEE